MLPHEFPTVPKGFAGPVMIEVWPTYRTGRGRFWRPKGGGYTDFPWRAGLFSARAETERYHCVSAVQVLRAAADGLVLDLIDLHAALAKLGETP